MSDFIDMPPNGKQSTKKKNAAAIPSQTDTPPISEKKSPLFWAVIALLAVGIVIGGLYFSGRIFQKPTVAIESMSSATGKIISLSPSSKSFVFEIKVPFRSTDGETIYAARQKTVIMGENTNVFFDESGLIDADAFFQKAEIGDKAYASSDNFLNSNSFMPDNVILKKTYFETEEEAQAYQDYVEYLEIEQSYEE